MQFCLFGFERHFCLFLHSNLIYAIAALSPLTSTGSSAGVGGPTEPLLQICDQHLHYLWHTFQSDFASKEHPCAQSDLRTEYFMSGRSWSVYSNVDLNTSIQQLDLTTIFLTTIFLFFILTIYEIDMKTRKLHLLISLTETSSTLKCPN